MARWWDVEAPQSHVKGAARLALRAVLADAPLSCTTAKRDSVVRLAVGEKGRTIVLAVRTCLTVRFNVTPDDARVRFESLDGGIIGGRSR